ncbi:hypothetical protein Hanom_Chr07g00595761 [Helianthus anomalus]
MHCLFPIYRKMFSDYETYVRKFRILTCTGGSWEVINGVMEYTPLGLMRRTFEIPVELTHSELMTWVARKLNLSVDIGFKMSYQFPLSSSDPNKTVVVDIADDEDVEIFIEMAKEPDHGLITLYVTENLPSGQDQSCALMGKIRLKS